MVVRTAWKSAKEQYNELREELVALAEQCLYVDKEQFVRANATRDLVICKPKPTA